MQLGVVKEHIWLSQGAPAWRAFRLVAVTVQRVDGSPGGETVAADVLGARIGETVLVGSSSRVRDLVVGPGLPFKSVIVAIVDDVERAEPTCANLYLARSPRRTEVDE